MSRLILTRLVTLVPLLLLVSVIVFVLIHLTPVDPIRQILGEGSSMEQRAQLARELGYDRALPVQFGDWVLGAFRGDLGVSIFTKQPILETFLGRLPVTLALVAGGALVAIAIGVPLGVFAALRSGSAADRVVTGITSLGLAIPGFWLALLLVLGFAVQLRWFPVLGFTRFQDDPAAWARGLVLPSVALAIHSAAVIARQTRGAVLETLRAPYVQALRAVGTPRRRIVYRYALRNAMVPIVTVIGWELAVLLAVSFVVERVFAIPGTGTLLLDAVVRNDIPLVQGGILLVACMVVLINLAVDVAYGLLDPKARPQ
ncbi:ABC transporter permease [Nonomuraea typhae]|uniref:ABC transporter permease n=1 Tax=Nonomuraea typhae TaxID=2603600 RepID=UPI0012FC79C7|nr:ABC transporter permease [Nonomuraea typhae]